MMVTTKNKNSVDINSQAYKTNKYDLEDRVTKLAVDIILCIRSLPQNLISNPLISQIVRSSTSIGANYMEANACNSKRDFINRATIAKKEAKETVYWFTILSTLFPEKSKEFASLKGETYEIVLILSSIIKKIKVSSDSHLV